ncbi:MAG TPA: hypothetical protein VGP55_05780 [Chitinophagaceae bacterium]|nr:hypothetical protein [Chitinophagaceae bacterium]
MRINTKQLLFNQPILKIREVIRHAMTGRLSGIKKAAIIKEIATILVCPASTAKLVFEKLIQEKYLTFKKKKWRDSYYYEVSETEMGRRLAVTRANPLISRAKADLLLAELIERVETVNNNPDFVYKVENLKVFGSYLSDQETLGDLDVAVKLVKKVTGDEFKFKNEERIRFAYKNGRTFSNFIDQIYWPYREVMLQLKTRKKGLSLHEEDDVLNRTETKVVYQD